MKGSPVASSCSSPSSSSSAASSSASSSCVDSSAPPNYQLRPTTTPKSKRSKRNRTHQNAANRPCPSRSSMYRGVTRHRWTGRFEAHLWDKSSWNNIQTKKGRQVYLGAYDSEETAAHTHDLAALKYWGPDTTLNFPLETYNKELEEMQKVSKEEHLASLRRRSSGFSRGVSKYRGVARHHHNGRWEARIGRVLGNKYLYLGTYNTQEEAAEAYDMAAIEYRGPNAVTNFDISNYTDRLKKKGTHLDPSCSTESDDAETEVEQPSPPPPTPPPILHQRLMLSSPPPSVCNIDTTATPPMTAMEDATMDGDDHFTWGFCSEYFAGLGLMTTTTTPLSSSSVVVPDLPDLGIDGCELPDLFDEVVGGAFEDNIDLIFETCCSHDCGPHVEYDETSDTLGSGVVLEEEAGVSAGSAVPGDREVVENGGKQTSPLVISCNHSL